jgi:diphthine methyl ester acylhydrolase
MALISSTITLILDLPPSCIEFWDLHPEYFVIGTYNLEKQEHGKDQSLEEEPSTESQPQIPQQRNGSLKLCKVSDDEIQIVQTLPTDFAILDLHFAYERESNEKKRHTNTFYTANSTGSIASYEISLLDGDLQPIIREKTLDQIKAQDILILSLCFHPTNPNILSATTSAGETILLHVKEKPIPTPPFSNLPHLSSLGILAPHSLECWTSSFLEQQDKTLLFSGGDDGILQFTTLSKELKGDPPRKWKHDEEQPSPSDATKLPRKFHSAGITAILPLSADTILTGSYDDNIRLILLLPRPSLLAELNLGGGVWRLKILSARGDGVFDILASCMHAGTRILRVQLEKEVKIEVLVRFEEHESMNYGTDVQPRWKEEEQGHGENPGREYTVVSTSFYDKRVCLWRFRP